MHFGESLNWHCKSKMTRTFRPARLLIKEISSGESINGTCVEIKWGSCFERRFGVSVIAPDFSLKNQHRFSCVVESDARQLCLVGEFWTDQSAKAQGW